MVRIIRSIVEAVVMSLMNAGTGFEPRYTAVKAASQTLGVGIDMSEVYKGCSMDKVDMEEFIPRVRALLEAKTNTVANALYEVVDPPKVEVAQSRFSTVCANLGWSEEDALDVLEHLGKVTIKGNFSVVDDVSLIKMKTLSGISLDALAKMSMENDPRTNNCPDCGAVFYHEPGCTHA